MDYQVRIYIEQVVNLIIKEYDISIPILDIDTVVAKMNGKIEEISEYPLYDTVTKDNGEFDFVIHILKNQRKDRRNVSIAQNLGTLFLHMGYMTNWNLWNQLDNQPSLHSSFKLDFEKDDFACNLLMPRTEFIDFVHANKEDNFIDTYKVAQYFEVPNSVAIKRGKWMGVLKW